MHRRAEQYIVAINFKKCFGFERSARYALNGERRKYVLYDGVADKDGVPKLRLFSSAVLERAAYHIFDLRADDARKLIQPVGGLHSILNAAYHIAAVGRLSVPCAESPFLASVCKLVNPHGHRRCAEIDRSGKSAHFPGAGDYLRRLREYSAAGLFRQRDHVAVIGNNAAGKARNRVYADAAFAAFASATACGREGKARSAQSAQQRFAVFGFNVKTFATQQHPNA